MFLETVRQRTHRSIGDHLHLRLRVYSAAAVLLPELTSHAQSVLLTQDILKSKEPVTPNGNLLRVGAMVLTLQTQLAGSYLIMLISNVATAQHIGGCFSAKLP